MEKLKFEFAVKAAEDPKSNVICITSLIDSDKNIFLIPEQLQPVKLHDAVIKTQTFLKVRATLQKRHEKRQAWITLSPELRDTYMDEDGNMQFKGYLLEEVPHQEQHQVVPYETATQALTKALERFSDIKNEPKLPNLKRLSELLVIEKFSKKTSSVTQWMAIFESECTRIGLDEDTKKIQVFRLFLDDFCQDWYNSMLIKCTVDSEWNLWKTNFCETFVSKGWSPIRYAFLYRYKQGSLLEYALKKERLLLEINKSIDKPTLIDLIVVGLPNFIGDELDRNKLKETGDLFNTIRGLEHLINKRIVEHKGADSENKIKAKNFKDRPCKICEKEKRGTRFHSESVCWFKNKDTEREKKEPIRSVNNSELEWSLNEIEPKN